MGLVESISVLNLVTATFSYRGMFLIRNMKKELKPFTALVPCPVVLLSVRGESHPNIITLSWAANICSKPPSIAVGIRPERFSYDLVKNAGEFVVNIPSVHQYEAAVFCGTKSGKAHDKFTECDLTAVPASKIDAPMIGECPINLECKTTNIVGVGAHDLFIAEIVAVHMDDTIISEGNRMDVEKSALFTYLPTTGEYWSLGSKIE